MDNSRIFGERGSAEDSTPELAVNHWNRKQIGAAAEEAAVRYLLAAGYTIVDRNWRCRSGELDIVAEDKSGLVVVEVRSRTAESRRGTAAESISPRKISQVRQTAERYLFAKAWSGRAVSFDVITVKYRSGMETAELSHYKNAF
ncbi:YraN family protein [Paenibacillus sp. CN-4]|uniref:YraN family protein n=1 Tax=Paenibacillus nanchangensis TaxID=3348343 RepID=UPI00397CCBC1